MMGSFVIAECYLNDEDSNEVKFPTKLLLVEKEE